MFFFFKQKTAYEMRISDWSSDVCSSDLATTRTPSVPTRRPCGGWEPSSSCTWSRAGVWRTSAAPSRSARRSGRTGAGGSTRSAERRVGEEGVRTCRSRWSPQHKKKNNEQNSHERKQIEIQQNKYP